MTESDKSNKIDANFDMATAAVFEMISRARRAASDGYPEKTIQYSQSALNVAQAIAHMKAAD